MTTEEHSEAELRDAAMADESADGAEQATVDDSPASPNMGREIKVGLTVIGSLMMVLAGIVYVRMGMPGIKSKHVVATVSPDEGQRAAVPTAEPPQVLAEPVEAPASDSAGAVDPFAPRAGGDRYAAQPPAQLPDEPAPVPTDAQAMPPAATPATPLGDSAGSLDEPAGAVQPVAGTEPAPLANHDLPAEPTDAGPLVPTAEPQLQAPEAATPPAAEQQGVDQAAHEPPLAEPHNAPYGERYTGDRYGAQQEAATAQHTQPHAAPAHAEPHAAPVHAEPHVAPPHNAPTHAAPSASAHASPPPHHDLPYEHADLAHRPTRDGSYVVEPNDSFWTISQKVYGGPGFFKALQRHNRKPGSPNVGLTVGEKISTPSMDVLRREYPNLCPKPRTAATGGPAAFTASARNTPHTGRTYVVEEGDTLFDIARYELGKASRWSEIYELNRVQLGEDYNHLNPGMRLALPVDAATDSDNVTSRPAATFK
jgi:nucleoid-associated protein YgaU